MKQSPSILNLSVKKTRSGKSRDYGDVIVLEHKKRKAGVSKFLRFEERFGKAPFC